MANYAVLENKTIIELWDYIPVTWNNITNFNVYENDLETLKHFGWYKIQKRIPLYDVRLQKLSAPKYCIDSGVVYEDYDVVQIISSEEEYINRMQAETLTRTRVIRNRLLFESDWTQNVDIQASKTPEWIEAWKKYRQELRDLPQKLIQDPKINIFDVQFPKPPE